MFKKLCIVVVMLSLFQVIAVNVIAITPWVEGYGTCYEGGEQKFAIARYWPAKQTSYCWALAEIIYPGDHFIEAECLGQVGQRLSWDNDICWKD